ncbi:MAG: beta strand repeat-containing protein, partial [Bacteroidia bacterium]
MKKIYTFLFSIFFLHSFSQAPKLINYQGVVRNAAGVPVTSPVKLKFEIFPVSSGGSSVFSEVQSTNTNSLGLFSTQIGKNSSLNINWGTGSWFLELSVDTTNTGNSFVIIGRQQMVSVPFALYAENAGSAPAPSVTFSNNILYIGTNSVSLPPAPVYFAGNGIAINSGTIVNTAPDQTITIAGAGNALVNGPYPDFTVTAVPQVLSITNNVISLSSGGGSVVLPATSTTPNTSLTSSGIATVTTSGTNTFNIAVAPPNIIGTGGTTVGGTYPNLTINSPTVGPATINGAGIASTSSSGNNYTVSVPGPVLSYGSNVLTINQGTASSAVTIPAGITPSMSASGIANVTPFVGNSFTVNVPSPTLSYASNVLTISQGTASSIVTIPSGITPTITGQGIATVTPLSGNNFTVNVAPLNLTGLGSATVAGTYPNLTINTPVPPVPPAAWLLLGNSGTIDGTHFVGTTDNVPLNFRVNNQKSGRIDPFSSNTFFGYWSGRDNTIGTQNTAFGINSLLNTTSGAGNTAIGASALGTNTVGNSNTAIGNSAGLSNNGSGNVFIGYQAGYNATGNSQLYIANSSSGLPLVYGDFSTGRIGLGTTAPVSRLHLVDVNANMTLESSGGGAALSSLDLKTISAGTASLYKFNTGRLALSSGGGYNMQFLNSIGGSYQFDEGSNTRLYIASGGNVG